MNLGNYIEEQGQESHKDIKEMELKYQGRWDLNMLADYCWTWHTEVAQKGVKEELPFVGCSKIKQQDITRKDERKFSPTCRCQLLVFQLIF